MIAKKMYFMDRMIDKGMSKLFQLAEYVCSVCSFDKSEPAAPAPQQVTSTIRFMNADKPATKREKRNTRPMVKIVERELFE